MSGDDDSADSPPVLVPSRFDDAENSGIHALDPMSQLVVNTDLNTRTLADMHPMWVESIQARTQHHYQRAEFYRMGRKALFSRWMQPVWGFVVVAVTAGVVVQCTDLTADDVRSLTPYNGGAPAAAGTDEAVQP